VCFVDACLCALAYRTFQEERKNIHENVIGHFINKNINMCLIPNNF